MGEIPKSKAPKSLMNMPYIRIIQGLFDFVNHKDARQLVMRSIRNKWNNLMYIEARTIKS